MQTEGQKTQAELANTRSKADNLRNSLLTTQRTLTASQDATQELQGKASNLERQLAAEVLLQDAAYMSFTLCNLYILVNLEDCWSFGQVWA